MDEVIRGVKSSLTAICVICPQFFDDRLCKWASEFALAHHARDHDQIVFVILEYPLPEQHVQVLSDYVGVRRLRFTDNESGRALFWARLDSFLPAWLHQNH